VSEMKVNGEPPAELGIEKLQTPGVALKPCPVIVPVPETFRNEPEAGCPPGGIVAVANAKVKPSTTQSGFVAVEGLKIQGAVNVTASPVTPGGFTWKVAKSPVAPVT